MGPQTVFGGRVFRELGDGEDFSTRGSGAFLETVRDDPGPVFADGDFGFADWLWVGGSTKWLGHGSESLAVLWNPLRLFGMKLSPYGYMAYLYIFPKENLSRHVDLLAFIRNEIQSLLLSVSLQRDDTLGSHVDPGTQYGLGEIVSKLK